MSGSHYQAFREKSQPYAPLGYFVSEVSRLEHALDNFILIAREHKPEFALKASKRFPAKIVEKLSFWISALLDLPTLRTVPFLPDGRLNLNDMYYNFLEIFDCRNHVAHGATVQILTGSNRTVFTASKIENDRISGTIKNVTYRFSTLLLYSLSERAGAFRRYFDNLRDCVSNTFSWECWYQEQKILRDNRRCLSEMGVGIPQEVDRFSLTIKFENTPVD